MAYPRKPTKLKILEGNPGKRRLNPEPELTPGVPDVPKWLDADARACWDSIVPELDRLGLLSKIDGGALEGACVAYSRALAAGREIAEHGLTMRVGEDGYLQQRPEVSIEAKSWAQFRAFCQEFGLTPAARSRLSVNSAGEKANPLEDALNRPSKSELECSVQ